MSEIPDDVMATAKQLAIDLCGFDDTFYDPTPIARAIMAERERYESAIRKAEDAFRRNKSRMWGLKILREYIRDGA